MSVPATMKRERIRRQWARPICALIVLAAALILALPRPQSTVPAVNGTPPARANSTFHYPVHAIPKPSAATSGPVEPVVAPPVIAAATVAVAPFPLTARAAYAVDVTSQAELYAENADTPLAPASTAKIVTAVVVMRHASPDVTVTVDQSDLVDATVFSHMGLAAGDVVSVRNLLAGMLINSAGDAALALSRYVGNELPEPSIADPRQRFVDEMNRVASQLGMKNSHFINADGRDSAGQVTSARDLAIAAADLFQYQLLQQLVATSSETVSVMGPNARDITLYSTNEWLPSAGVHGVKTGTTANAGQCLVLAVWRGTDRVITVVLGSSDRYADTTNLLNYLDQQYHWVGLGRGGDFSDLNAELAQKHLSLGISRTLLLTAADAGELHYTLAITPADDRSPFAAQGEVVFLVGSRPVLRLSVYLGDPFKPGG